MSSGGTFAFAGFVGCLEDKDGLWLQSFAVVTTEANELMSRIQPACPSFCIRKIMTAGLQGRGGAVAARSPPARRAPTRSPTLRKVLNQRYGRTMSRANIDLVLKNRFYIGTFAWAGE